LVDHVISKIAPFASCVRVGQTHIFMISNDPGSPALLVPTSFKGPETRSAAVSVAIPWQSAKTDRTQFFGRGSAETCPTTVDSPLYAGNFAFVSYSEPGGKIGAYAFRLRAGAWREEEAVVSGYW